MRPKPYSAPPFYPCGDGDLHDGAAVRVRAYLQVRDYTCGFASTLTVLHTFRRYVEPADLYQRLGTDRSGTRQTAIVRELRAHGLSASVRYDLAFEDMARVIDDGGLIIGYHHRIEHWLVVFGYRVNPRRLLVADSYPGHRTEHDFEVYGPKLANFGIICRPRRGSARLRAHA